MDWYSRQKVGMLLRHQMHTAQRILGGKGTALMSEERGSTVVRWWWNSATKADRAFAT